MGVPRVPPVGLEPERYLQVIAEHGTAMAELASGRDLGATVPGCPGWDVAELLRHLGAIHRWAGQIVRTGERAEVGPAGPSGERELVDWFAAGVPELVETLRSAGPDRACWTFGLPRTTGFWLRRQAHETLMHHVDLCQAYGAPVELAPDVAGDGIDEVLTMFYPRQVRLGRVAAPTRAVRLVVPGGREWRTTDGLGGLDGLAASGEAGSVTGSPSEVLLVLWNRLALSQVAVEGDAGAVAAAVTGQLTP